MKFNLGNIAMRTIKNLMFLTSFVAVFCAGCQENKVVNAGPAVSQIVYLDELDVTKASTGWGATQRNKSIDGNVLTINGQQYLRGIGTHTSGKFIIELNKGTKRFTALVGVDDEIAATDRGRQAASVEFMIIGDKKILWQSGMMKYDSPAKTVDVVLTGVNMLILGVTEGDNNQYDHADWVDAKFEVVGQTPKAVDPPLAKPYILTPKPAPSPKITGPRIFGVRPGSPFLFTVTATGDRPMAFSADGLPAGLSLDSKTGRITGVTTKRGEYIVKLSATNKLGVSERDFKVVVGDKIALTPPMGWNSWNCWGCAVDAEKVRATAKAIVDTGLIDHGWSYINIDDCWMRKEGAKNIEIGDPVRDENGYPISNAKFPDMKGLTDYIHDLGLKAGIYISPGPTTCQGYIGSWEHELFDAQQFAMWGFDYLKYDWCGYSKVSGNKTLQDLQRPYILMREKLNQVDRDIVYSLCQYGWGDVWTWGEQVGGDCWRTTGDIYDSWSSMAGIGFSQYKMTQYASPGNWNDPDMLVVGKVGWGPNLHPSRLTPDEQYTHISLWSLLCSPLLIGCPIEDIDEFTLSLLTNDEVLDVNQDPLGKQASRIVKDGGIEIWAKDMEDGSKAVGLFNRGDLFEADITVDWDTLGIKGKHVVRDLWRQKDLSSSSRKFTAKVPVHGVVLLKITKK